MIQDEQQKLQDMYLNQFLQVKRIRFNLWDYESLNKIKSLRKNKLQINFNLIFTIYFSVWLFQKRRQHTFFRFQCKNIVGNFHQNYNIQSRQSWIEFLRTFQEIINKFTFSIFVTISKYIWHQLSIYQTYSLTFLTMQKESYPPYIDHSSWLDCLGQLKEDIDNTVHGLPLEKQIQINLPIEAIIQKHQPQHDENSNNQLMELIEMHQCIDREMFKRSHPGAMIDDEFFSSNSSSHQMRIGQGDEFQGQTKSGYRKQKYAKQYIYSKNYRDKKKQQFKALEQQNHFLKTKIQELQMRLRQKELEINRLKHHSNQKDLTIEELNRQFLTKVSLFAQKIENSITQIQVNKFQIEQKRSPFQKTRAMFCDQLIRTYDEHGFSGSRKRDILNYHMNQIMQVVLRDSEKYLCMLCCKNRNDKLQKQMPEYYKINNAFFQIMELKQEDYPRLRKYIQFLFPMMKEIKKSCSDIYKSYNKIMECNGKIHQFMKSSYIENLDFVKKRMKFESWFEYHKYHKIMRKLKAQWLEFVKNEKPVENQNKLKRKNGHKKKKTQQTQNQ